MEATWFTVQVGFSVGSDWDTVQLGLRSLENVDGELTLTGEAPFYATIVSVRYIDEDTTKTQRCGFLYRRLDKDGAVIDPLAPSAFAPYEAIVSFTIF